MKESDFLDFKKCIYEIKDISDYLHSEEYKNLSLEEKVNYLSEVMSVITCCVFIYGLSLLSHNPNINTLSGLVEDVASRLPRKKTKS